MKLSSMGPPDSYGIRPVELIRYGGVALLVLVAAVGVFVWFFCRIDVGKGEFAPLMRKTGENISNSDVLAPSAEYKGPQFEILREGRHFRNPYVWHWPEPMEATVVPQLNVGVLVRRYGEPLELGQVVVDDDRQKGILADPLGPGRHYVNLWAHDVELHQMVNIEPGYVGVVTRLVGRTPENANVFVVAEGERGTQPFLLPPGTHPDYSNPYVYRVTPIDVRSQKFEMSGQYGITFPSRFGFDIKVEGTIEWAPDLAMLPEVFVKYVDEQDLRRSGGINNIQRKIILPFARSYFRTIGGQHRAVDYITGDTRVKVQEQVEQKLKQSCAEQGISIKSFVIRATEPPRAIRDQYERREIALREIDRYTKEIETEIGAVVMENATPKLGPDGEPMTDATGWAIMVGGTPKLNESGKTMREGGRLAKVIQERQKDRESKLGGIRVQIAQRVRDAERYQAVEVTKAEKDLAVATITLEAAKDRAARVLADGVAQADVTVMKHNAEAEAVRAKIGAFGSGEKYAEYQLITKFAPGVKGILSNTDGLFAELFERFANLAADPADR